MHRPYPIYKLALTALMLGLILSLAACQRPLVAPAQCPRLKVSPSLMAPAEAPAALAKLSDSLGTP